MFNGFNIKTTAAAVTLMGALFVAKPVQAASFGVNFQFGYARPIVVTQPVRSVVVVQPQVQRRWVAERFETRTENIVVAPERIQRVWVPETYRNEYRKGRSVTVHVAGYYKDVLIPAQYETRSYTVRVAGYWEEVQVDSCGKQVPTCGVPVTPTCGVVETRGHDENRWNRWDSDRRTDWHNNRHNTQTRH